MLITRYIRMAFRSSGTIRSISALLMLAVLDPQGEFAQDPASRLNADLAALESARSTKDLDAVERLVQRDSVEWQGKDRQSFMTFMFAACSILSSYDLGDQNRQTLMLDKYATSALAAGDMLSIREQVEFVEFLTRDPIGLDQVAWKAIRQRKARIWLRVWSRVAAARDPTFDFNDRPVVHVRTPEGAGLPAGVAPEAITDAKLRVEYESAIAANAAKLDAYNTQYWLKQNAQAFSKTAERYLVGAYSTPPVDVVELQRLLAEYLINPEAADRILSAVGKRDPR